MRKKRRRDNVPEAGGDLFSILLQDIVQNNAASISDY